MPRVEFKGTVGENCISWAFYVPMLRSLWSLLWLDLGLMPPPPGLDLAWLPVGHYRTSFLWPSLLHILLILIDVCVHPWIYTPELSLSSEDTSTKKLT